MGLLLLYIYIYIYCKLMVLFSLVIPPAFDSDTKKLVIFFLSYFNIHCKFQHSSSHALVYGMGAHILQKCNSHFKMMGAIKVTKCTGVTLDLKILGTNV
jgi:hypothetical protein